VRLRLSWSRISTSCWSKTSASDFKYIKRPRRQIRVLHKLKISRVKIQNLRVWSLHFSRFCNKKRRFIKFSRSLNKNWAIKNKYYLAHQRRPTPNS
jgi:hypothetical protein